MEDERKIRKQHESDLVRSKSFGPGRPRAVRPWVKERPRAVKPWGGERPWAAGVEEWGADATTQQPINSTTQEWRRGGGDSGGEKWAVVRPWAVMAMGCRGQGVWCAMCSAVMQRGLGSQEGSGGNSPTTCQSKDPGVEEWPWAGEAVGYRGAVSMVCKVQCCFAGMPGAAGGERWGMVTTTCRKGGGLSASGWRRGGGEMRRSGGVEKLEVWRGGGVEGWRCGGVWRSGGSREGQDEDEG